MSPTELIAAAEASKAVDDARTRRALLHILEDLKRERNAASEARRQWIETVDAVSHPMMVHDHEFRILRANRAYAEQAGMEFDQIIGRRYWECFPKRSGPLPACERSMQQGALVAGVDEEFTLESGKIFLSKTFPIRAGGDGKVNALHIFEDITERKCAEKALRKVNRALRTLSAGNEALVRATDEDSLLKEVIRVVAEVGAYPLALVAYASHDPERLVELKASVGFDAEAMRESRPSWADNERGQGVVGRAIRLGGWQIVRDVMTDPNVRPWRAMLAAAGVSAVLGLPLRLHADEAPFGALAICAPDPDAFDEEELKLLSELAADLGYGIANLRARAERRLATKQLRASLEGAIEAFAATMESRDPYTAGHQRRVAELAASIAREMGMPEQTVEGVHLGAQIHDLGKIQVPAEILAKPSRLSKLEFDIIKNHAQAGYDIVKGIDFPWPVAAMVHQHHERMDGSGYPQGLKGNEIALEARILAVADVVEAMASHRPYRPGLGLDTALREIEDKRGKWFDEAAVDACLRLFRQKGFTLPA